MQQEETGDAPAAITRHFLRLYGYILSFSVSVPFIPIGNESVMITTSFMMLDNNGTRVAAC